MFLSFHFPKKKLNRLKPSHLNNTKYAESEIVFFNRAAKVGSESLMELLQNMQLMNNITVINTSPVQIPVRVRIPQQEKKQADWIDDLAPGSVYIEHCNWLNFTRYKRRKPIYINLVRNPVERVISWYFYVRGAYKNAIYYSKYPDHPIQPESWFKKDFNHCVRSGDPECLFIPYTIKDTDGNHKRQSLFFCGNNQECL